MSLKHLMVAGGLALSAAAVQAGPLPIPSLPALPLPPLPLPVAIPVVGYNLGAVVALPSAALPGLPGLPGLPALPGLPGLPGVPEVVGIIASGTVGGPDLVRTPSVTLVGVDVPALPPLPGL